MGVLHSARVLSARVFRHVASERTARPNNAGRRVVHAAKTPRFCGPVKLSLRPRIRWSVRECMLHAMDRRVPALGKLWCKSQGRASPLSRTATAECHRGSVSYILVYSVYCRE